MDSLLMNTTTRFCEFVNEYAQNYFVPFERDRIKRVAFWQQMRKQLQKNRRLWSSDWEWVQRCLRCFTSSSSRFTYRWRHDLDLWKVKLLCDICQRFRKQQLDNRQEAHVGLHVINRE